MGANEQDLHDLMALLPIEGAPSIEKQVAEYLSAALLQLGVPGDHIGRWAPRQGSGGDRSRASAPPWRGRDIEQPFDILA